MATINETSPKVDYVSAINQNGSGLNTSQIVESLVQAETAPVRNTINKNIEAKNTQISSLAEVVSSLNTFKNAITTLSDTSKFGTSSASTHATLTVDNLSTAKAFNSDLSITNLATPQTLEFTGFTSASSSTGSGNITVDFGQWILAGSASDADSVFSASTAVNASTSLGTPNTHTNLGGFVTITTSSGGNQSSTIFTVVGTDMDGNKVSENITGQSSNGTRTGITVFKTITSITPGTTVGSGTVTIGHSASTSGTATDSDSLFSSGTSVNANTSLGTPTSHSSLGGVVTIATSGGGNQSATVFTVVGTDMAGNVMTENITGNSSGASRSGTSVFKTVTSITPGSTVGSGTVTVGHTSSSFGINSSATSKTISVGSGSNTITGLATSLSAIAGVTANVINKGDGTYSLVVRSDTGVNNAIRMTVSENASDTGLSTFDNTSDNGNHQTSNAKDAVITVDGVVVNRSSNSITDLFEGYQLDITAAVTGSFRIKSELDTDNALEVMNNFINALNTTRTKLNELTKKATSSEESGPLSSDPLTNTIKKRLTSLISEGLTGYGNDDLYLTELGVQTLQDGSISLNATKFKENFVDKSTVFDSIFNSLYSSSSPYLDVDSLSDTPPVPGRYSWIFNSGTSTATLAGFTLTSGTNTDLSTYYAATNGDVLGVKVTPSQTVDTAFVYYGESLIDKLNRYTQSILSSTGDITKKQNTFNNEVSDYKLELTDLDDKMITIETRYKEQFTAMETAISSLKNTGDFLTNMMDAFNKDN